MSDPIHAMPADMGRLIEIMRRLRDPQTGCPWDIEQSFKTIAPYTIEEAYEVHDAIEREAWDELRGELGDLLFQAVFHSQMANEAGHFTFDDVVKDIGDKMIARHPHIFADDSRDKSAAQQEADWEAIKAAERAGKKEGGTLDGVAFHLPALLRAYKLQKRMARVGYDWPAIEGVFDKLEEEMAELSEARAQGDMDAIEDEMGDVLFVAVNLSRHLGVEPEAALRRANAKIESRWAIIDQELERMGKSAKETSNEELEHLWQQAKKTLKSNSE